MAFKMCHNNKKEVISFVGKGTIDGKNVEVHFKTNNFEVKQEDRMSPPTIVIDPLLNEKDLTFVQVKAVDDIAVLKTPNPALINGKYIVMFKKPRDRWIRNETKYETFEGICENFVTTGKCAFTNENQEMLIVHYDDIVQLKPVIK